MNLINWSLLRPVNFIAISSMMLFLLVLYWMGTEIFESNS